MSKEIDQAILREGLAEIQGTNQLLKTPFVTDLRKILIEAFQKITADMRTRMLNHIDHTCAKSTQVFYNRLRENVLPTEPTIRESEIEGYIDKILKGDVAS